MNLTGIGQTDATLTHQQVQAVIEDVSSRLPAGKRILLIVPDYTRTCPLGQVARLLHKNLRPRAEKLDMLIALGTHPAMSENQIDRLLEVDPGQRAQTFGDMRVFNHCWDDPAALIKLGTLQADDIAKITDGQFAMDVEVNINRLVMDYDLLLIVGPVFPHEVVGFSGGSKYFFPGISGPELLNFFHWLGAIITSPRIIGTKHTPVRATIEAAAAMIPRDKLALCMVVNGHDLSGLYFGRVQEAWSAAADLSDKLHTIYVDQPYQSVLSQAPLMYDELWVAAKCLYKLEPVVADGGELIIYAPHLTEISATHGKLIEQIGYHTRDYFRVQWDKFKDMPWGVLAHSTHLRGIGTYENGVEHARINVTLASGIDEATCRRVNLGYRDPASINPAEWQGRTDRLYVPKAGEMLYKLKNPPAWQTF